MAKQLGQRIGAGVLIGVCAGLVAGAGVAVAASHGSAGRHHAGSRSSALVKGHTAAGTSGSEAQMDAVIGRAATVMTSPTLLASTAKLDAGTYYVTGTADLGVPGTDTTGSCFISTLAPAAATSGVAQSESSGSATEVETGAYKVKSGDKIRLYCKDTGGAEVPGKAYYIALTAIRVAHSTRGAAAKESVTPVIRR